MKYLQLSQNKVATVCDCHYDLVKDFKWHYQPSRWGVDGYGQRSISYIDELGKKRCKTIKLHRAIMLAPGTFVDPEGAAQAYNVAATKYFGEFAGLNK